MDVMHGLVPSESMHGYLIGIGARFIRKQTCFHVRKRVKNSVQINGRFLGHCGRTNLCNTCLTNK